MNQPELEQLFQFALDVSPQASIICDSSGTMLFANEMFVELAGVNMGGLIGSSINDYFPVSTEAKGEGVFQLRPCSEEIKGESYLFRVRTVSYTHLTLPTIYSV